ncbi:MFS transporter [Pseudomonas sp. LB-090624]|uniref:MFS transporter n=1 Tax=Pseudomonas sp. LB-090624 TaxID=2213079 RepID=UPI000D95CA53|nr:MFS transporter [Pseudomonas sp. LB-090624]PYB78918.1 MFS transporter [Pseudomonas sp. LB-090624]
MSNLKLDVPQVVKPTRFRWIVAGMIFLVYTIAAADRANLGVALPFIRKEFEMSNTEAGALISLFLLAYALAQLPSGFASSRFGVRKILPGAMIATSLFTGLVGTVSSVIALKIYRVGLGLAEGPLPIGMTSTINNWFPAREKGTATGIFLSAVKFGPVIVPPLCAVIIAVWGWREIFYFFAIPGIVLSIAWYFLITNTPSESRFVNKAELEYIEHDEAVDKPSQAGATAPARRRDFRMLDRFIRARREEPLDTNRRVFRSWNIWGCALGYCFQLGISSVLLAWIPTYLVTVKNYSLMNMGLVSAAPWVGAVIGNILGGFLSDRVLGGRRKPGMMLSALATAVMMYLLINSPADPLQYGMLLLLTGILLSVGYSSYMVYPMGLATKKTFPISSAVVNMGGQLGGAATPLITGILLDSLGWNYVFLFMAISSLLSFVILLTISEPLEQQ